MNASVNSKSGGEPGYESRIRRTTVLFLLASFLWAAVFVLVDKALLYGWFANSAQVVGAIAISSVLGVVAILAYVKHLASMDELQQKVQFNAMAFSLGTTLVGAMTYMLATAAGLVGEPDVRDLVLLLALSYMAAVIVGQVRYR